MPGNDLSDKLDKLQELAGKQFREAVSMQFSTAGDTITVEKIEYSDGAILSPNRNAQKLIRESAEQAGITQTIDFKILD